jgi:CCR4-NOT transcription complex subunit 7/8
MYYYYPYSSASLQKVHYSAAQPMTEIREVWASNLEDEFVVISQLVDRYPYVAMDTEFPGFIAQTSFHAPEEQRYAIQALNVNLLRIIQIGITLGDDAKRLPSPVCTWQFNFKFSQSEDLYTEKAIQLLVDAGINFHRMEQDGIDVIDFAHLLLASGLVMNENVVWISFHGGYDFAYLLKILTGSPLPAAEDDFNRSFQLYFPHFYDIKQINFVAQQKVCGLSDAAQGLNVPRLGRGHQAGSDSHLTLMTFFKLMERYYNGVLKNEEFKNHLFGLTKP